MERSDTNRHDWSDRLKDVGSVIMGLAGYGAIVNAFAEVAKDNPEIAITSGIGGLIALEASVFIGSWTDATRSVHHTSNN